MYHKKIYLNKIQLLKQNKKRPKFLILGAVRASVSEGWKGWL